MNHLVLIHGFAGTTAAWDGVLARLPTDVEVVRITVGGHAGTPASPSFEAEVERIAARLDEADIHDAHVCGYSLGGRLAFGLLARDASRFARATIIGAHVGLAGHAERTARAAEDEAWAELIEREGIEVFAARWEALPMFASQSRLPAEALELQRRARRSHEPAGLAGAMRGLGLGRMPYYGDAVAALELPIRLVTGAEDAKFTHLASALQPRLSRGTHDIAAGAGHNVPLERPDIIAELLRE